MTYLITGGAGFIGSHITDRLLSNRHKVIVIDNFSTGKTKNLALHKNNGNLIVCKRNICENLDDIFLKEKINAVFHLAAIPMVQFSIENPAETHHTNVNGTINLLEACRKFNVQRFIFTSSSAIYGDQKFLPLIETMPPNPMSPYALHKVIGEQYCKLFNFLYKLKTISLRYTNVFGPRQNPESNYACLIPKFIKLINSDAQPVINGDGAQTRDFIYIDDIVDANIKAAETKNEKCFGQVFNIGTAEKHSVNEVTELLLKISGKNIKPIHGPAVIEPRDTLADISKAKKLLKWEPKNSFEQGLKKTWEYFSLLL